MKQIGCGPSWHVGLHQLGLKPFPRSTKPIGYVQDYFIDPILFLSLVLLSFFLYVVQCMLPAFSWKHVEYTCPLPALVLALVTYIGQWSMGTGDRAPFLSPSLKGPSVFALTLLNLRYLPKKGFPWVASVPSVWTPEQPHVNQGWPLTIDSSTQYGGSSPNNLDLSHPMRNNVYCCLSLLVLVVYTAITFEYLSSIFQLGK